MESVMEMARGAFGGETLARLSSWLGESPAATRAAVQDALPVSLVGLANQASSEEGSRDLLNRLQRGDYPHLEPEELNRAVTDPAKTERLVQSSQGFMGGMFGGKMAGIVEGVAEHAGISRAAVAKLLGLAGPLVMGMIGKSAVTQHLDAGGLRRFLGEQRNLAASLLPGPVARLLAPAPPIAMATATCGMPSRPVPAPPAEVDERRRAMPWWIVGLLAVAALLAFAWNHLGRRQSAQRMANVSHQAVPTAAVTAGDVGALTRVLEGKTALPQRLLVRELRFGTSSAEIEPGTQRVLNDVADVLAAHPNAKIRVEGHTDGTGAADTNRRLSQARAEATKRYIADRGVDAGRIEAVGYGAERPVGSNDTTEGRLENRRTELVVTAR
jgi:OOP family OmpA-OmpF porin